jgi:hypothetical protein
VGATPTLPPHPQPPPTSRNQRTRRPGPDADQDLVLGVDVDVDVDQPTRTPATPADELEREGDLALEDTGVRLHRERAEADPISRTATEPESLGRRLPEPLDANREGVER